MWILDHVHRSLSAHGNNNNGYAMYHHLIIVEDSRQISCPYYVCGIAKHD